MTKIKVKIREGSIIEFTVDNMYFRKVKVVEPEFYTQIMTTYYIGEFKEEKVYGDLEEYEIDEAAVYSILKDFPDIKVIEDVKIYYE